MKNHTSFFHRILAAATASAVACLSLIAPAASAATTSVHPAAPTAPTANPLDATDASAQLDGLSLSFEQNLGQFDPSVRFRASGNGFAILLSDRGATFVPTNTAKTTTLAMKVDPALAITGESKLDGVANYLIGNDPHSWRTGVPTFAAVRYSNIQPGVDLVFYGSRQRPEYDFVVAPGADPNHVGFSLDGAASIRLGDQGDLIVATQDGELTMQRPVLYQDTDSGRTPVSGAFVVDGSRVRFAVGSYDHLLPLVIDPALGYATLIGGTADDRINGMDIDASGNAVVAGSTLSTNFPTHNSLQGDQSGMDGFVAKFNSDGTSLVFATYLGGRDTDNFNDVDVNPSDGRIALAGSTASGNAIFTNGYDSNPNGLDAWIVVLSSTGSTVLYSSVIGGGNNDIGNAIAWDIHDNAYLAGETLDTTYLFTLDFPTKSPSSLDPFQKRYGGGRSDAFVTKWDPDQTGNGSLVYSTLIGGSEGEGVEDIVVDDNERAYVCGYTESPDFPRLSAVQSSFGGGGEDGFITKFNADGTTVFYSTFYGGNGRDEALGIALDVAGGNLPVVCGLTTSTNLTTVAAVQAGPNALDSGFALKLIANGGNFVYATYFGGDKNENFHAVTIDAAGNAYFTGINNGGTFPDLNPIQINGATPTSGAPVVKLSPSGQLLFSTRTVAGTGEGIAIDAVGNIFIAGTSSNNIPTTPGAFQSTNQGINDGFVLKIDAANDDTIGVWTPNTLTFKLRNSNTQGSPDLTFAFGATGDKPIAGDWNGDGIDTIGAYTPATGRFSLRNSNSAGAADVAPFVFGGPNLQPISGDWDGDGVDTIGVFDTTTGAFFLKNSFGKGNADLTFFFGPANAGAIAIAGDWNGDGVDTIGVFVPSSRTFFLRNTNDNGNADIQAVFGFVNSIPVAGDWDGDGIDTIGAYATITVGPITIKSFMLRNTNTSGSADINFPFGSTNQAAPDDLPVIGNWDGK